MMRVPHTPIQHPPTPPHLVDGDAVDPFSGQHLPAGQLRVDLTAAAAWRTHKHGTEQIVSTSQISSNNVRT
jgi:hypothetical protein